VPGSQGISLQEARAFGNRLLFACDDQAGFGNEPWISDGTFAGTFRLADLSPGTAGSTPGDFVPIASNRAVFQAYAPATGYELYVTDGTTAGTQLLYEFYPGAAGGNPDHLVAAFGGVVFGAATQANGNELWFTDGTTAGTTLVADSVTGVGSTSPAQIALVGSRVFYRGFSPTVGVELYVSDNTVPGTYLVADLATPIADSTPREITPTSTGVVFGAVSTQNQLWRSDGTLLGTFPLNYGSTANNVSEAVDWNGLAYISGYSATAGYELLVTDGTQANSTVIDVLAGSASSYPEQLAVANGRLWFAARQTGTGLEPHVTDGTQAGTVFLGDLYAGAASSSAANFTACGPNRVVFSATDSVAGRELWVSDGTPAGTQRVVDLWPGVSSSDPSQFLSAGNVAFFRAYQPSVGYELFVTDGTAAGTQLVANLATGATSSMPQQLVRLANGTVLFVGTVIGAGAELCRTDGTAAGTTMVAEIVPGTQSSLIESLTAVGNLAFFTADDGVSGRELYVSDGLTITQVRDIYPGAPNGVLSGSLRARASVNGVVFAGSDGNDGLQIWVSDGTAVGTTQVGKIGPWAGSGAVDIGDFVESGGDTWFWCDDGITGKEPWRITIAGVVAAATTFGLGCGGTGNQVPAIGAVGLPQLGNAGFAIRVQNGLPASLGVVAIGPAPTLLQIGTCRVLVAPPWTTLPPVFLDPVGAGAAPLPIPANPALAGVTLHAQYLVLDPNGQFLAFASLSNALSMLLGS
jgi:ELWxxDGT repeat protein